ncbi:MAG: LPS-assembly protein LptD [Candidatus Omnitrophica bacterium]|nr:LPS-assembly protein LptD [Candidatus Omnitrophota bacterium]
MPLPPVFAADEPVAVRGEQVEYFDSLQKVVAVGNVTATYRDTKLTCDHATLYMATHDAYLRGRVRLAQPGGLIKGEEILYNFETRKGTVLKAEGEADLWRFSAERAQKVSGTSLISRTGVLTSCDFEEPHTRFQAKEVRIFLDDKVVLKHALFYVGGVPLLYLPSYTHPLDDKRPRVTIIPGKDKQWGLFLLTAWRFYVNEDLQGRIHVDYRERLDLASGADIRYRLPNAGEGVFRTYYTNERALQREHLWAGLTNPDKDQPTQERERFRVQVRHRWEMDKETTATLEYHRQKDPMVVRDFFIREDEKDQTPETYFQLFRASPWYGLTFLVTKRVNRFESVIQKLPSLALSLRPLLISWLPGRFYYQSSSSYDHFNRAEPLHGTRDSLLRFDTLQEVFHPLRLFRWLNLRPFAGIRQTTYSRGAVENSLQQRGLFAGGFEMNTRIFRVFDLASNLWGLDINRLRHIITPTLEYRYDAKPTLSASRLPQFDGTDALAKGHQITPGIEHKLQTKRLRGTEWETVDLARFLSKMSYDLEGSSGRGGRWNSLALDAEFKPTRWLLLESDAAIDPHIGKFSSINADFILSPALGPGLGGYRIGEFSPEDRDPRTELPWFLGVGWRYQRNTSAQAVLETGFNLGAKWRVGITQGLDVKRFITETTNQGDRTVKKIYDVPEFEYRLRRDLHEWTVELVYNTRRAQGESIFLVFRLKAFPDSPLEFQRSYHQPKAGKNFPRPGEKRD